MKSLEPMRSIRRSKEEVIMSIEGSERHKLQRRTWIVDRRAFEARSSDAQDELRRLKAEAYHVASMALLFQGVLFTAVAQARLLTCALAWSPVALSVIVALGSLLAAADKLYEYGLVEEEMEDTDAKLRAIARALVELDNVGADLDLDSYRPRVSDGDPSPSSSTLPPGFRHLASFTGLSYLSFLVAFSAIIAIFSYTTLCSNCISTCAPPTAPNP